MASSDQGTNGALMRPANGSRLSKSYTVAQIRALLTELKLHLMSGEDDGTIQQTMGLTPGRYNELKKELYRQEKAAIQAKSTEDVYLEYVWNQTKCLQDLETLIPHIPEQQPNAVVGAIKARSEIHDKMLKVGQDMGIINKEPERKLVIHGHVVAQLDNNDLRRAIVQETNALALAIAKYGDRDIDGNPIVAPEPTFTPIERSGQNMAGPSKAAAARKSRHAVKRSKVIDVDS
jgi:hypothetical protein